MNELEQKNLILYFVELAERKGLIKNKYKEEKEKLNNLLMEIEKILMPLGHNKLHIHLEDTIGTVIEIVKNLYFEYGKIANTIEEDYILEYEALK